MYLLLYVEERKSFCIQLIVYLKIIQKEERTQDRGRKKEESNNGVDENVHVGSEITN